MTLLQDRLCVRGFFPSCQLVMKGCGGLNDDKGAQPLGVELQGDHEQRECGALPGLCCKNSGRVVRSSRPD